MSIRRLVALSLAFLVIAGLITACHVGKRETQVERGPTPPTGEQRMAFQATAYSIEGTTASGTQAREGVVAADPDILPLGTRIRVHGAGGYSGEYVVRDTGRAIKGREIDLYVPNDREAKRFGRKSVQVEIIQRAAR